MTAAVMAEDSSGDVGRGDRHGVTRYDQLRSEGRILARRALGNKVTKQTGGGGCSAPRALEFERGCVWVIRPPGR
jgi:hypothetical protein